MSGLEARGRQAGASLREATAAVVPRRRPHVRSSVRNGIVAAGVAAAVAAVVVPVLVLRNGTSGRQIETTAAYVVPALTPEARAGTALAILDELRSGDYTDIRRGFDSTMAAGLSESRLAASWQEFTSQFGSYRSHGNPTETQEGDFQVIQVPVTMSVLPGELRVAYDRSGRIAGLFLLRAGVPVGQESAPVQPDAATAHLAQTVVADLTHGDYAAVEARFDPTMKAAVSQDRLRSAWQQTTSQLGAFQSSGAPVVAPLPMAVLYDFPLQLAGGAAHLQIAIDARGHVAGLYIKPGPPTGRFGE